MRHQSDRPYFERTKSSRDKAYTHPVWWTGPVTMFDQRAPEIDEPALLIRDLGPLLIERPGEIRPVGGALAAVLTLLLVRAGEPASTDAIADAIWGDSDRRSASTVTSHLSRLRSILGTAGTGDPVLQRTAGGLTLNLPADRIDSRRFETMADQVRALLGAGRPGPAVARAAEATSLWRGRPYSPLSDAPWAAPAVARLEELYAQVRERFLEGLLADGDAERALVELRTEIPARPLRERLWALRMLAEYRTGRLDEALRTFHDARTLFLDELGVEPSAALADLQAGILAGDPALGGSPAKLDPIGIVTGTAQFVGRIESAPAPSLPNRRGRLIGRAGLLDSLQVLLREHRLVTLTGAAGCGKTRLAVEVARAAVARFADGVWWVDLTATEAADQVVDAVVSTIGLAPSPSGTAQDALLAYARDRKMLLVLDNCEQVLDPVARLVDVLLAAGAGVSLLATSREPLSVDTEIVRTIPPLTAHHSAGVEIPPAVELFVERLTAATGVDVTEEEVALAQLICQSVDGVPLAVELAAARARAYTLAEIANQVATDPSSLARIGRGGADHHRTVRYAIEQTYRSLTAAEASLHRALSVVPGAFTVGLAATLDGRPTDETVDLVAGLVHRSMVVALGPSRPGRPSQFAQLATVRGHAGHCAVSRHDDLVARRNAWVRELIAGRPRLGRPAERGWLTAIDDDLVAVRSTLQHTLVEHPDPAGISMTSDLVMYWYYRGMVIEGGRWIQRAVDIADRTSPSDRGLAFLALASARTMAQRVELARPLILAGLAAVRETPPENAIGVGEALAAVLAALGLARDEPLLRRTTASIAELSGRSGDPGLGLLVDLGGMLADLASPLPRPQVAERSAALWHRAQDLDDHFTSRLSAGTVAILALGAGRLEEALLWSDRQIAAHVALGLTEGPVVLEVRANLLAQLGDASGALRLYAAGEAHHRRVGLPWPQQPWTTELRRQAAAQLSAADVEAATIEGASLTLLDLSPVTAHPAANR